jgi:exonuclease VII large subunit
MQIQDISPATLQQATALLLEQAMSDRLSDMVGIVRVHGRWTNPGRAVGKHYYAKVTDDGGAAIKVEIPVSLVIGRGISPGQNVFVTGHVHLRNSNYGLEVRVVASNIQADGGTTFSSDLANQGSITLEHLRTLPIKKNLFPDSQLLDITVIHSTSAVAQVYQDCMTELSRIGQQTQIHTISVNMLDAVAVTSAIRQAPDVGILILIRGGGDTADFEIFDDPRVISEFAGKNSFRVAGIGHSGNKTLLDIFADFSANTPTQAGTFVREHVENRQRQMKDMEMKLAVANRERDAAFRQAEHEHHILQMAYWGILIAFVLGAILTFVVQ